MPPIATNRRANRAKLNASIRHCHHGSLITTRADNWPQSSLVTVRLGRHDYPLITRHPECAKCPSLRHNPRTSVTVTSAPPTIKGSRLMDTPSTSLFTRHSMGWWSTVKIPKANIATGMPIATPCSVKTKCSSNFRSNDRDQLAKGAFPLTS